MSPATAGPIATAVGPVEITQATPAGIDCRDAIVPESIGRFVARQYEKSMA